jgi:hypothetical protein
MHEDPDKSSFKAPLLFTREGAEIRDSLTAKLRAGRDPVIASELAEIGGRILESSAADFAGWSESMVSEVGEFVRPQLANTWRSLPSEAQRKWGESVGHLLTQNQRVLLSLARSDFLEKWREAEDRRTARRPTRREQELMTGMAIDTPEELEEFLNQPSRPALASQSRPPYEELDLVEEERQEDEEFYESMKASSRERTFRISVFWEDPFWSLSAVSTAGVLVGFTKLPHGYYMLLRLLLCLTSVYALTRVLEFQRKLWIWIYGVLVFLYNPVFPVRLGSKSVWEVVNLSSLVMLWMGAMKFVVCSGSDKAKLGRN